ncbi:hypothetical protein [[Mycoplasma] gypis]|uniref:ECM-binding protein homolog n=1 Tax=[Mycoplasma] gypis TaxID=92404 RepID=A0ABZ2RMS8_9BACT|nr:hypothetical protein [[Mycoplasma] gypis]MBN0919543.1 hypothetical protein [[Mycoplasma] gypis]
MNKKLLSLVGVLTVATVSGIVALSLINEKFDSSKTDFRKTFEKTSQQFSTYSNFLNSDKNKTEELNQLFKEAKNNWKENKNINDIFESTNKFENEFFDQFTQSLISKISDDKKLNDNELMEAKIVLYTQRNRISEAELLKEFDNLNNTDIDSFIKNFNDISKEQKNFFVNSFTKSLKTVLDSRKSIISPLLNPENPLSLDNMKIGIEEFFNEGVSNKAKTIFDQIKKEVFSKEFRKNEIDLALKSIKNNYNNYLENKEQFETLKNSLSDKMNQLSSSLNNNYLQQNIKDIISKYLNNLKAKQNIAETLDDFKKLQKETELALETVNDTQRNLNELKNNLRTFVVSMDDKLQPLQLLANRIKNNNDYPNFIDSTNDKNAFINQKAKLVLELSNLYNSLQTINQVNDFLKQSQGNNTLLTTEVKYFNDQIVKAVNDSQDSFSLEKSIKGITQELSNLIQIKQQLYNLQDSIDSTKIRLQTNSEKLTKTPDLFSSILSAENNLLQNLAQTLKKTSLKPSELSIITKSYNELHRQDLKSELKLLVKLSKENIEKLSTVDAKQNENIIVALNDLNAKSEPMILEFSVYSSPELEKQIKKYSSLLLKSEYNIYIEQLQKSLDESQKILNLTYNKTSDPNWKPSKNEKSQLDILKKYQEQLDNLKKQADTNNNLEPEFINLGNRINNLKGKTKGLNDLNTISKDADELIDSISQNPEKAELLKDKIDLLKKIQDKVVNAFKDESLSIEDINKLNKELLDAYENLNNANGLNDLNDSLNKLQQKVNETYNNDFKGSQGNNVLNAKIEALKNKLKLKHLSDDDKLKIGQDIQKLSDSVSLVFELDKNIKENQETSKVVNTDEFASKNVEKATEESKNEIHKATQLIEMINSSQIPDLKDLQAEKKALENTASELNISLQRDIINNKNSKIQSQQTNSREPEAQKFNQKISEINSLAKESEKENGLNTLKSTADKFKAFVPLADVTNKALGFANNNKNDDPQIVTELNKIISENLISANDDPQTSQEKYEKIEKALQKAKAQKDLKSSLVDLNRILGSEKGKDIYQDIADEIDSLNSEYEDAVTSDFLDADQLRAKNKELQEKIANLKQKKVKIDSDYNGKVQEIEDDVIKVTDTKIDDTHKLPGHNNDQFPLYEKAKQEFNEAKNKDSTTIEDLDKFKENLLNSYQKDKLNNRLAALEVLKNNDNFDSTNLESPAKEAVHLAKDKIQEFIDNLNKKINNVAATQQELTKAEKELEDFEKLAATQLLVSEQLQQWNKITDPKQKESKSEVNETLSKALERLIPNSASDYMDADDKTKELRLEYEKVKEIDKWRTDNYFDIEDITTGLRNGLKQAFIEADPGVDDEAAGIIDSSLDKLLKQNATTQNIEDLKKINSLVTQLKDKKQEVTSLVQAVKIGKDALTDLGDTTSDAVSKFKKQLQESISLAQNNYIPTLENVNKLAKMKDDIINLTAYLKSAKEIEDIISQAKQQLNGTPNPESQKIENYVDFFAYQGTSGEIKKSQVNKWLDNIQEDSIFKTSEDTNTLDTVAAQKELLKVMKARAQKALLLIQKEKVASDIISEWKLAYESVSTDPFYAGYQTDIDLMLSTLWDNAPIPSQRYQKDKNNNILDSQIQKLSNDIDQIKSINEIRIENAQNIKEYSDNVLESDEQGSIKQIYPLLHKYIARRLKDINSQNISSKELQELKSETDTNAINQQIEILKNITPNFKALAEQKKLADEVLSTTRDFGYEVITEAKNKVLKLIEETINSYQTESNAQNIDNLKDKLEDSVLELKFWNQYALLKYEVDSNGTLSQAEKQVIFDKLENVSRMVNDGQEQASDKAAFFDNLYNTYLNPETHTNDSIPYVFANSKNLRQSIDKASEYFSYQQKGSKAYLESSKSNEEYEKLQEVLNGLNSINTVQDNDENAKITANESIDNAIRNLVNQKQEDASNVKEKASSLLNAIRTSNIPSLVELIPEDFEEKAIEVFDKSIDENENKVAVLTNRIEQSVEARKALIISIYQHMQNTINQSNQKIRVFKDEFADIKTRKTEEVNSKYIELTTTQLNESNGFLNRPFDLDSYLQVGLEDSANEGYLSPALDLLNTNKEKTTSLINAVKERAKQLFENEDSQKGLFQKMYETINPLTSDQNNLFDPAKLVESKNIWTTSLKTLIEQMVNTYSSSIKDTDDANLLASYNANIEKTYSLYYDFISKFKEEVNKVTEKRKNLEELFSEIFLKIRWNTSSEFTNDIKANYTAKLQEVKTELNQISNLKTYEAVNEEQATFISSVLTQLDTFIKWPVENKIMLFNQLLSTNIDDSYKTQFDKRYKIVVPKSSTTRTKLGEVISGMQSSDSDEIDITNSDVFLDLFNDFAFTKLDVKKGVKSVYNPNFFRVKIVKNQNQWWQPDTAHDTEAVKYAKIRIKYEYTPGNLTEFSSLTGISEQTSESGELVDLIIPFQTVNEIKVLDGSSSLIYQGEKVGFNSKVEVLDPVEAGWSETDKSQIEQKAFNAFKDQVLKNQKFITINPNENSDSYKFEFINSPVLNYENSGYSALYQLFKKQILKVTADDNTRELVFFEYVPGSLVSAPAINGAANESEYNNLTGDDKPYYPLIPETSLMNVATTMPGVTVNVYRFKFDYSDTEHKLFLYTTWFESNSYVKNAYLHDDSIASTNFQIPNGQTRYNWSPEDFAKYMSTYFDKAANNNEFSGYISKIYSDGATFNGSSTSFIKHEDLSEKYFNYPVNGKGKLISFDNDNSQETHVTSNISDKPAVYNSGTNFFKFKIR